MKPSEKVKSAGLSSLAEVSRMTGQSVQTLGNWYKDKPDLFDVVLSGCLAIKEEKNINQLLKEAYDKGAADEYKAMKAMESK